MSKFSVGTRVALSPRLGLGPRQQESLGLVIEEPDPYLGRPFYVVLSRRGVWLLRENEMREAT
jgi:hypothetical protein